MRGLVQEQYALGSHGAFTFHGRQGTLPLVQADQLIRLLLQLRELEARGFGRGAGCLGFLVVYLR